jgi:hypothetical protein
MRIICVRMITARRIMGSNQMSNLANSSNMRPLPQVSGFTFVVNPSRTISTNVSLVAVQYRLPQLTLPSTRARCHTSARLVRHKPKGEFPQAKIWKLDGPYFRG